MRVSERPVVLVGYKESSESRNALRHAIGLANELGADLRVIHAIDLSDYPIDPDAGDWDKQGRAALNRIRETVEIQLRHLAGHGSYEAVRGGNPASVLHEAAVQHRARMIVIGVHARSSSPFERFFFGSVQHGLTRRIETPLLLVPLTPAGCV